ncbi:MAG: hypothetical protein JSU95_08295 [Betaproteobacteria bacterium]|nr:MAG: hypothetical protein JSU95_08295 [Betaproteobacteria bacterium]
MHNNRFVWLLFVTSVWLFIGLNGYEVIIHAINARKIVDAYPGGYGIRIFIAPFFLLAAALFLWFKMFRPMRHPARIFAGLVGGYIFLMVLLVNVLVAEVYDRTLPATLLWLYSYSGVGHLVYAFFGRERRA